MDAVQLMVEYETNDLFCSMNVDHGGIELEENEEAEEAYEENSEEREKDFEEQSEEVEKNFEEEYNQDVHFFENIDGGNVDVSSNWTLLRPNLAWNHDLELSKGLTFKDKLELQRTVRLYSIKRNQKYEVVETKKNTWLVRCKRHKESGCNWRLRACQRKSHQLFEITKYDGLRTCVYPRLSRDHSLLDSNLLAQDIESQVKIEPSITVAALQEKFKEKFFYDVSYKKMWHAKQKTIKNIFGDWDTSYKVLPKFMAALEKYNDVIVMWRYEHLQDPSKGLFHHIFWAFPPSIEGFKHCKPVISIDDTHLYGRYKGKMLIAMGVDGNNQLFPLSFGIVEEESFDSWRWFLGCVREKVTQRKRICLISDRHQGIRAAVNEHNSKWKAPWGYHRFCLRHICSNFNDKFHNQLLKVLIYRDGSVHQSRKFDALMKEIEKISPEARKWLDEIPVEQWALAHDGGHRYGIITTNLSEVFNSVLKGARSLPITACIQLTLYRLVKYFTTRRGFAEDALAKGDSYTPHVMAKLQSYLVKANTHSIVLFDRTKGVCEVITAPYGERMQKGHNKQVVKLDEKTCSCGKWQIYKFPCSHVMAVCGKLSLDSWQYIEGYYTIDKYFQAWASQFSPIPHEAYWPESNIPELLPDPIRRRSKKGRPRSTRIRNEMDIKEGKTKTRCGICKQPGHDRRTCKNKK